MSGAGVTTEGRAPDDGLAVRVEDADDTDHLLDLPLTSSGESRIARHLPLPCVDAPKHPTGPGGPSPYLTRTDRASRAREDTLGFDIYRHSVHGLAPGRAPAATRRAAYPGSRAGRD